MISLPFTKTVPLVGVTITQIILIRVVFPAPLGPSKAKISPFFISRLILFRALKLFEYIFDKLSIDIRECIRDLYQHF